MKALLIQVGLVLLVALAGACGAGYAASRGAEPGVVIALRDISLILLALFSLVGTIMMAGVCFGGAWAIGRFGPKAVTGVSWVSQKALKAETMGESGLERAVVRPLAKTARAATAGVTLVRALVRGGDRAAALARSRDAAVRTITSLSRQRLGNPLGRADG